MKRHPLTPRELHALQRYARLVIDREGNQVAAAKALDMPGSVLSEFINSRTPGPSLRLVMALAGYEGLGVDAVLGRAPRAARVEGATPAREAARELASLPGFDEALFALEQVNDRSPRPIPRDVIAEAIVASFSKPPARVTPEFIRRVCEAIVQGREDDLRSEPDASPTRPARRPR